MVASVPRVSVCVPSIGRLAYWQALRQSLRDQTLQDYEVLVLDNAAEPEAARAFAAWAASDARVRVLRVEQRLPMFDNFDRGLAAARAPLVTYFHDDDVYLPRMLEVLVRRLEQNPDVVMAGSNFDYIDETGAVVEPRRWIARSERVSDQHYLESLLGRGRSALATPGLVFRTEPLRARGFASVTSPYFGDFELFLHLTENAAVWCEHEPLVWVRRHAERASELFPWHEALGIRERMIEGYLDGYLQRHPERSAVVARLRRRAAWQRRVGSLWGWLSAVDEHIACASARELGESPVDRALSGALQSTPVLRARGVLSHGMAPAKWLALRLGF